MTLQRATHPAADGPRGRLFGLIRHYPGLHLRELARQADLSEALAGYHVRHLLADGLVDSLADGNHLRLFARRGPRPHDPDQATVAVLRQRIPLQIVLLLLECGPLPHGDIAQSLGLSKSTASYHLAKLLGCNVIATQAATRAFAVKDRTHVMHLLDTWRPPTALAANFEATWAGLYGRGAPRKRAP